MNNELKNENTNEAENLALNNGAVMYSQSDDDAMIDWYISRQPILTDE